MMITKKSFAVLGVEPEVSARCTANFADAKEAAICMRSAHAGMVLAKVLSSLSKDTVEPAYSTPDSTVVTEMYDAHPAAQCRLDTYYAAAICKVAYNAELDVRDYHVNSCIEGKFKEGMRPKCWFKPDAADASVVQNVSSN